MKTTASTHCGGDTEASSSSGEDLVVQRKRDENKKKKKKAKLKKEMKKEKKSRKRRRDGTSASTAFLSSDESASLSSSPVKPNQADKADSNPTPCSVAARPLVESSALSSHRQQQQHQSEAEVSVTLLLFYQYVEPPWDDVAYKAAKGRVESIARAHHLTGRMRVAKEGLNCTLTAWQKQDMYHFCQALRDWQPHLFLPTEFKLTHDLPPAQAFKDLKLIPVHELVHYGLEGPKAPPIQQYSGTHLEPAEYHKKLAEPNTVVIDVRNHYEAIIGHFDPPKLHHAKMTAKDDKSSPPKYIDPLMRKSTEFPVWLDRPDTKEQLAGKQVLMFCTGGIRCERASALLKYKMETDPSTRDLNIQGVYQLQGGIDKYFKEFPDGGYWKGKNYVFDKRFAHAPVEKEEAARRRRQEREESSQGGGGGDEYDEDYEALPAASVNTAVEADAPMAKCESCSKPWDKFRGKRRCPTCGVPSLICRDCFQADQNGKSKLDRSIRCDLCTEQDIRSKKALREKEEREIKEYEARCLAKGVLLAASQGVKGGAAGNSAERSKHNILAPNPENVTRLFLKNMCRNNMTEEILMDFVPGITHIVWRMDRKSGQFFGQGWVEMKTPAAAAAAVARSGENVLGRPLYISFQKPDGKDAWPPPSSAVARRN